MIVSALAWRSIAEKNEQFSMARRMVANGPRYKILTSGAFDPALSDLNLSNCLVDLLFGTCISTQGGSRLDGASSSFSRLSGSTLVTAGAAITWGPRKDRKMCQVFKDGVRDTCHDLPLHFQ